MSKKRYNFTLDEDVKKWLTNHCKENRTTCSVYKSDVKLKLMNSETKPTKTMKSIPTKSY